MPMMSTFEIHVVVVCILFIFVIITAAAIAATLYPLPDNHSEGEVLSELFFDIDNRVKNDATLYWLLEKYCQDAFSGFIWMRFSNAKQSSAVARITIAMNEENTRKCNRELLRRNRDIEAFRKVNVSAEEIEKKYTQLKLRCFDTDAGYNFSNLIIQQGLRAEWVIDNDEHWGVRFILRETNYQVHSLGRL